MTKNLIKLALVFAVFTLVAVSPAAAQTRIGTVDLRKVFEGYWKTKQADTSLKERASELDEEIKQLVERFEADRRTYTNTLESARDQAVSEEERQRRKRSAEEQEAKLVERKQFIDKFGAQARTTLDDQRKRMRENILIEIKSAVTSKAKAAGHTLVLDTAAQTVNDTPIILYSTGENDLTSAVLSHLNANAPEAAPGAAATNSPGRAGGGR